MTTFDTSDSRFPKAVQIADGAAQWFRCQTAAGKRYGIRSSRDPNHYYLVSRTSCTCEDAQRHPSSICKHSLAVQIHVARVAGKPMPASDVLDGLADMIAERKDSHCQTCGSRLAWRDGADYCVTCADPKPVLTMVRHDDGEVSWERRDRLAARYDDIFGRL